MSVSRRSFVKTLGAGGVGAISAPLIAARGHEALIAARWGDGSDAWRDAPAKVIRLDSNENPLGPAPSVLEAIRGAVGESNRYAKTAGIVADLTAGVAAKHRVKPESVLLGCGSTDILRVAVYTYTSPTKALVTALPTFEDPGEIAQDLGAPVRSVRVDGNLRLDLAKMLDACSGAGLVFVCNPNNPTGTLHPARAIQDFVAQVNRVAPQATVVIDEAYFDYVDDPNYATALPLAMSNPRVIVSRTFSKVYGMAGLRVGYALAHPDTIKEMQRHRLGNAINIIGAHATQAALKLPAEQLERERARNREVKAFARRTLESWGFKVVPSETNFLMVDIRRDVKAFQDACKQRGVWVGRPFPPLDTHARISIGTMDEMQRAMQVVRQVLAVS